MAATGHNFFRNIVLFSLTAVGWAKETRETKADLFQGRAIHPSYATFSWRTQQKIGDLG